MNKMLSKIYKSKSKENVVKILAKNRYNIVTNAKIDRALTIKYLLMNRLKMRKRIGLEKEMYNKNNKLMLVSPKLIDNINSILIYSKKRANYGLGHYRYSMYINNLTFLTISALEGKEIIIGR